jgi:hypothetical protein
MIWPAALAALLAIASWGAGLQAADPTHEQLFGKGVAALNDGAYDMAIATLEALADRGVSHPDAAYNRGLAYLGRVRAQAEQPGDLGRAAAAFEECLEARAGDTDAEQALDLVRAEVARRRAQRGGEPQVQARPTLDRAVVGLMSEGIWALCTLISSWVLTAGLILRRSRGAARHLTGVIATPIGAACLLCFGGITLTARHLRKTTSAAVVVSTEARMLDENGVAASQAEPVPEAARVELLDRRGVLAHIRYGAREGWTQASGLRVVPSAANR